MILTAILVQSRSLWCRAVHGSLLIRGSSASSLSQQCRSVSPANTCRGPQLLGRCGEGGCGELSQVTRQIELIQGRIIIQQLKTVLSGFRVHVVPARGERGLQ